MINILLTIIALFIPPLSICLKMGLHTHFWINLLLTLFGYIPGLIHSIWLIWIYREE